MVSIGGLPHFFADHTCQLMELDFVFGCDPVVSVQQHHRISIGESKILCDGCDREIVGFENGFGGMGFG